MFKNLEVCWGFFFIEAFLSYLSNTNILNSDHILLAYHLLKDFLRHLEEKVVRSKPDPFLSKNEYYWYLLFINAETKKKLTPSI